jgi:hypothetical protein
MIAMVATTLSEFILQPNIWRIGLTYQVVAAAFPLFLVAAARAGRLRFTATAAAAAFMLIFAGTQWILVQFPATPRLTPIMRPVTNMVAFGFPILLIVPAVAIDLVHRRRREGSNEWVTACALGFAFVASLVVAQWPFTRFLVSSPLARNDFFLAERFPYWTEPGNWQTQFWSPQPAMTLAVALLVAIVLAAVSARAGLWWGRWLRTVRR